MNTYLNDMEKFINEQYNKAEIWYKEIESLDINHQDVSISNTKFTFIVIGLNSIIELVHETIIKQYFVSLFDKMKKDHEAISIYADYEKEKIINIIDKNDSAKYSSFIGLMELIQGRKFKKDFNDALEIRKSSQINYNGTNISFGELHKKYNDICEKILKTRNIRGHNPENYFTRNEDVDVDYSKVLEYILLLKTVQKILSEVFHDIGNSKYGY